MSSWGASEKMKKEVGEYGGAVVVNKKWGTVDKKLNEFLVKMPTKFCEKNNST